MKSGYSILPIMEASSPAVVFDPSRPVDPEQVLHVLAAVQDALAWPSLPRLEFIIVDDRQILDALHDHDARVRLVAVFDPSSHGGASQRTVLLSLGCVLHNLWLISHARGLGFQVVTDETALLKRILKIPDNHEIAFEVRLGWPSRDHASSPAGRSLQDAVHWNRYH